MIDAKGAIVINITLSDEQQRFVETVKKGRNVLVDACIGSGKTTAIQALCDILPRSERILYLTYNRLLKLDAKEKIRNPNTVVTNYHGFASMVLRRYGESCGVSDLIQTFNRLKPKVNGFALLILDEYQDIERELASMLIWIKECNPGIQIVAVGDMRQKIYDKTTLDVSGFIDHFLGDYELMEFTKCFRLNAALAEKLGRIWKKKIVGVNRSCHIKTMTESEVVQFLSQREPADILCLGQRTGHMVDVLNRLERENPLSFNKQTVYASIRDSDGSTSSPKSSSAIFTTYDSSKGLERKICVLFDFTDNYWQTRIGKPEQSYEILRNIFCVAASRGKSLIIFVRSKDEFVSERTLSTPVAPNGNFEDVNISELFDFKYKEDIEDCYSLLSTRRIPVKESGRIEIRRTDALIDISPCIGISQEAFFFENFDIESEIRLLNELNENKRQLTYDPADPIDLNILKMVAFQTGQDRYKMQVRFPFVPDEQKRLLRERLGSIFSPKEKVQEECRLDFLDENGKHCFSARGRCDVIKNGTVYELKYVSELAHEHFLQCACYMIALKLRKGILWNTYNNEMHEIEVPDTDRFLDAVAGTVTKGRLSRFYRAPQRKPPAVSYIPDGKKYYRHAAKKKTDTRFSYPLLTPGGEKIPVKQLDEYRWVQVGARLVHKRFGEGRVTSISGQVMTVDFQLFGVKQLLLSALIQGNLIRPTAERY